MRNITKSEELNAYISNQKFSDGFYYTLESDNEYLNRKEFLMNKLTGKTVIHLGFADHLDEIDVKISNDTWLHGNLVKVAQECIGLDINTETISYLKKKYNQQDIYDADITNETQMNELLVIKYDYLIIPDVIEHIDNPIAFLTRIVELHKGRFEHVIITVPNAFNIGNFMNAYANTECINTDHNFWFSPYTITRDVTKAGLEVKEIRMLAHGEIDVNSDVYHIAKDTPIMRDTIAVVCTFKVGE